MRGFGKKGNDFDNYFGFESFWKENIMSISNILLNLRWDTAMCNILIFGIFWKASMLYKLQI